ncbi:MAG: transglutaminase domain-containing protein [Clostridiales bacterium]|nr:transglutaminase domain-containing protein [Clostridiales bacterium]
MANRNTANRTGHTAKKAAKKPSKFVKNFMAFLKKVGVTNPLLQVALPIALSIVVVTVVSCAIYGGSGSSHGVKKEVNVTYDTPLTVDLFLEEGEDPAKCQFVSDVSVIDMSQLATYQLTLNNDGHKVKSILNVIDDVPPVAEPVPQYVFSLELPDPNDCVTNIVDKSEVTVGYAEGTDISMGGSVIVSVVLTDAFMNQTVIEVPFECTQDFEPPVIVGTHDFEFPAGQIPDYTEGVVVTDNLDPEPDLTVSDFEVDGFTPGQYTLQYIASDAAGNETMVSVNVTVTEGTGEIVMPTPSAGGGSNKKYSNCTTADAYAAAQKVYNKICNGGMSAVQKGLKIFYWVNHNISFSQYGVDYTSFASLACQAFATRHSSCYGHWACCKALCDIAGIPNRTVYRSGSSKYHVWCLCYLNGGWYHCDATPWPGQGHYFIYMMTDAEVLSAPGNHRFLSSGLPARATTSVQKYININSCTVSSSMPIVNSPTPTPEETLPSDDSSSSDSSSESSQQSATPTPTPVTATATPTETQPPTATPVPEPPPATATPTPEVTTDPVHDDHGPENGGN